MQPFSKEFRADLRASPDSAIIVLAALGMTGGLLLSTSQFVSAQGMLFILLMLLAAASAWFVKNLHLQLGAGFLVLSLTALIGIFQAWFNLPDALGLLVIPTCLALTLLGVSAAALLAIAETIFIFLQMGNGTLDLDLASAAIILTTLWGGLGAAMLLLAPVHRVARWSWDNSQRVQTEINASRTHQAQLTQALDALVHANQQLALMNKRIAAFRQAAEAARCNKEMFVARVSHEFRAPLNIIIGMVSLMVESPQIYEHSFSSKAFQHLQIIYRSCNHLGSMIDDVLDLSQADAGRMALHREWVDFIELMDSVLAIVRPLIENKGLFLHVDYLPALPPVECDRLRIRQVLLNLLSNAARYTEQGGIHARVARSGNMLRVSVTDTGPGIAPENIKRVFEPFSAVGKETRRTQDGTGLGLSISKQFIELHRGRIGLESQLGQGSTFFIELPLTEANAPSGHPGQWINDDWVWLERSPNQAWESPPPRQRIVVCDATGELVPALSHYPTDFDLLAVPDLNAAADALQQAPAWALLLNVPQPNRLWSVLDQLRGQFGDTPIVCCSFQARLENAYQAGVTGYITKPLTSLDLEHALDELGRTFQQVLVVDDDEDTRIMLREMLHLYDPQIKVLCAENGQRALELLRTQLIDLMLLDVIMPVMTGWELLAIREQESTWGQIPVIMISAQDLGEGPFTSRFLLASIGEGFTVPMLLRSLNTLPKMLLQTDDPEATG